MDDDNTDLSEPLMRPHYREQEADDAQKRFTKIVTYVSTAHLLGLAGCIGVWRQYPDVEAIQNVLITSAMIFAIGLATVFGAHIIFRTSTAMSREAARMRHEAGDDEMRLSMAREKQADAVVRAKSGFKPLNFSGVCFVVSTLLGVTGLFSI
ncbi:MAG: hypothetical protein CFH38_01511 [Alphaproteobacteria bacterium MarineAlpha10_Bin1]|jgi:hypothetical protein|nr:MAG: hypothetical protein CFH38_01511 [Alphaproteobacteria bacterium MarineAlpha10_Bin1]